MARIDDDAKLCSGVSERRDGDGDAAPRHRVLIIGGGFGGLRAAKALASAPVQITLIDRTNHHLFQPLLYQVATGVLSAGQIAPPLRSLFRSEQNVRVLLADVEGIDVTRRIVRTVNTAEREIPYDTLIVAAGASHSYFGHERWAQFAPGMKTLDDAARLRSRILLAFEAAEQETDEALRAACLTFAVVGAGPTGVELAGQVALLAHRILTDEYRRAQPRSARIVLLDAAPEVLAAFSPHLSDHAKQELEGLGVEVTLGSEVVDVDATGVVVRTGGQATRRIDARTVIWAAGVQASPLAAQMAAQTTAAVDRAGRLLVGPDLTLPGHPEVFVLGDMISLPGVPGTAQPAIQQGKYVAAVIRARLRHRPPPKRFRYRDLGTMAMIGRSQAVAELFGKVKLWGLPAFLAWGVIHLAYLIGWGSRAETVARWGWTLLTRNRRERLISVTSLAIDQSAIGQLGATRATSVNGMNGSPDTSPVRVATGP